MSDAMVAWLRAVLDQDEAEAQRDEHPEYSNPYPSRIDFGEMQVGTNWFIRDIAAKRRIVREATYWIVDARPISPNARQFAVDTLRLIASAYSDRDGYRPDWAPTP